VLSSLFPSVVQPNAGLFIRERMFRVGKQLSIVVVAPQAWFPFQGVIRKLRPHFRPEAQTYELVQGVEVHRPRFFSVPGMFKWADGFFMAMGSYLLARRLVRERSVNIIDAHFGYPEGHAGYLLGRWLGLPLMLTLRGKEQRLSRTGVRRPLARAVRGADHVITVSGALRDVAISLGADPRRVQVIGNGIDLSKFTPVPRSEARTELGLPLDARVLVTVGTLVERKGFHRVIEVLPGLLRRFPDLHYLIVGGSGPEGDDSARLKAQVSALGIERSVHFLGPIAPERLRVPLSAADLFVLASSYEGWANVLLEAMACGVPVVATDVGGNAQVVNEARLGAIVPFGDSPALESAIERALEQRWDSAAIRGVAEANSWESRIPVLVEAFHRLLAEARRDSLRASASPAEEPNAR